RAVAGARPRDLVEWAEDLRNPRAPQEAGGHTGGMEVGVRRLPPGEGTRVVASVRVPFLHPGTDDPEERAPDHRYVAELESERAWVGEDRGRFVANAAIASMDITLPAAPGAPAPVVPFAAVTAVGVHPTHRRRGLLRRMMAGLLADARA